MVEVVSYYFDILTGGGLYPVVFVAKARRYKIIDFLMGDRLF